MASEAQADLHVYNSTAQLWLPVRYSDVQPSGYGLASVVYGKPDSGNPAQVALGVNNGLRAEGRYPWAATTTPLLAGANWDAASIDAIGYSRLLGLLVADVAGTLSVYQSMEVGITSGYRLQTDVAVVPGTRVTIDHVVYGRYVGARFSNGGTNQALFGLGLSLATP